MADKKDKKTLWTNMSADKATSGTSNATWQALGIVIDNRYVQSGDLFIALKGPNNDGHNFVEKALEAGAVACVVRKDFECDVENAVLLRVEDTQIALEQLGAAARKKISNAKIIGVTGSVGKTGTKELLSIALSASGKTHASQKSYNNHWGVPLTLSLLPDDAQYGVFEMGMNHTGELDVLSKQVKPDIAIITNVEAAHIGNFASVDEIAQAKSEIFNGMEPEASVILNADNDYCLYLKTIAEKKGLKIYSFGEDEDADARLLDCKLHADHSRVTARIMGQKIRYRLNIPGKHIVLNSLATLLAVYLVGADLDVATDALRNAEPVEGRGTRYEVILSQGEEPVILIDESYNANPASMQAAFQVLEMAEPAEGGRRIAILGDMLELGPTGPSLHMELANPLFKAQTDLIYCCGPLMAALYDAFPPVWQGAWEKTSRDLLPHILADVKSGDVILVKGSLGSQMAYVVQAIQNLNIRMDNKDMCNVV